MSGLKLTCLDCGQVNLVAKDRLGAGPKCATCGAALMEVKVRSLEPSVLAKAIRNDDIPLVVDFWAPWCGPCKMMAPDFAKAATIMAGQARFAKINTEDFPAVSQKHGIRGIPLLAVFRGGREIARQAGAQRADAIASWLRMVIGGN